MTGASSSRSAGRTESDDAALGELERVAEQVEQDASESAGSVAINRARGVDRHPQAHDLRRRAIAERRDDVVDDALDGHRLGRTTTRSASI
jgi:hypothetical protein